MEREGWYPSSEDKKLKIIGYKIRRVSDGLYSTGGGTPSWRKTGKVWAGLNQLHNHFAVIQEYQSYAHRRHSRDPLPDFVSAFYKGCEIVKLYEGGVEDLCQHQKNRTQKV